MSFAGHPSGKAALSVGKNDGIRLWDLTKGICAHKRKAPAGKRDRMRRDEEIEERRIKARQGEIKQSRRKRNKKETKGKRKEG